MDPTQLAESEKMCTYEGWCELVDSKASFLLSVKACLLKPAIKVVEHSEVPHSQSLLFVAFVFPPKNGWRRDCGEAAERAWSVPHFA